jgi:hypothetical protein
MYHNVLDEPSPLGLRLKKSPSLLDLIQMRLSQASDAGQSSMENWKSEPSKKKDIKSGVPAAGERLKASNFPATILRIGTWEVSKFMIAEFFGKICQILNMHLVDVLPSFSGFFIGYNKWRVLYSFIRVHFGDALFRYSQLVLC